MNVEEGLTDKDIAKILDNLVPDLAEVCQCMLLIGSASEGLATDTSDVDLYIVIDETYDGSLFVDSSPKATGGKAVEISLISQQDVQRYKSTLARSSLFDLEIRELEKLHKVFKSSVVWGWQYYKALLEDFDARDFDSKVAEYHELTLTDNFHDMIGAERQGDKLSVVNFARIMVETAVEMLLAAKGDTYPKRKWIPKRIAKLGQQSPVLLGYQEIMFGVKTDPIEQFDVYVESILCLLRRIQYEVYIGDTAFNDAEIESERNYKSSSRLFVFRKNKRFYVQHHKQFFEVDLLSAVILMSMYAQRSYAELLVKIIRDLNGSGKNLNVNEQMIEKRIAALVKGGLLVRD